jgi:hypothetical protein
VTIRRVLAVTLLASAALFAVGTQIERHTETTAEATRSPAELGHDVTLANEGATTKLGESGRADSGKHGSARARGTATEGANTADTDERASSTGSAEAATAGATSALGEAGNTTRVGDAATTGGSSSAQTPAQRHAEVDSEAQLFGINPEAVGLVIAAVLGSVVLAGLVWARRIPVVLLAAVAFGLVFAGFDVREVLHQIDESRTSLIAIASVLVALHLLVAALAGVALLGRRPSARRLPA